MTSTTLALALLIGGLVPPPGGPGSEASFDRIVLIDGATLEGRVIRRSEKEVAVKLRFGELAIDRNLITRIETVKIVAGAPVAKSLPPKARIEAPPAIVQAAAAPASSSRVRPSPMSQRVKDVLELAERSPEEMQYGMMQKIVKLGPGASRALAEQLDTIRSPELLDYAAAILKTLKDRQAVSVLIKQTRNSKIGVRLCATDVIGEIGSARHAGTLRRLLKDREAVVRAMAVSGTGKLGDRYAMRWLSSLLHDSDPWVRAKVVEAMSTLSARHGQRREFSEILGVALGRAQASQMPEILQGITLTKDRTLWPHVARALNNSSPKVRTAAATTLGHLGAPESASLIAERLWTERNLEPKLALIRATGKLRVTGAVPTLIRHLRDRDETVKSTALGSLKQITGRNLGTDPLAWERWWSATNR